MSLTAGVRTAPLLASGASVGFPAALASGDRPPMSGGAHAGSCLRWVVVHRGPASWMISYEGDAVYFTGRDVTRDFGDRYAEITAYQVSTSDRYPGFSIT